MKGKKRFSGRTKLEFTFHSNLMIHYKGNTYNSAIRMALSDNEFENLRREYYAKPSLDAVIKQLQCIHTRNGVNIDKIDRYFFREIWSKVKMNYNRWSIAEAWEYKPIIEYFAGKTLRSEKTFPKKLGLESNIEGAFRLAGYGVCSKPSNFKMSVADEVISKYNLNNRMYDYSCGWGVRELSAFKNNVEYYGTDPNYELVDALHELALVYNQANDCERLADIRCHGSQNFVPEWEGTIGLAFSSPPYFDLEDYKIGDQSWKEGTTYEDWCENYFRKTVQNIYRYLIPGGYLAINIKNLTKGPQLADDARNIIAEEHFEPVETMIFQNRTRHYGHAKPKNKTEFDDTDEGIYIFRKA